jgi:hypothetical protein
LDNDGCYIKGVITRGGNLVDVDNNHCGGGWNDADLTPGSYRLTVNVTTDWGATKSAHYDFRVYP